VRSEWDQHSDDWRAYQNYRAEKKAQAERERQEAARKAREEDYRVAKLRWKRHADTEAQKAAEEAARLATKRAEQEGNPVEFETFKKRPA